MQLDSHRTEDVPAKPTYFFFYHIAQRKQLLTIFSVFHQSCTWKDLSLYLRMFSNWLPSTVSAGELDSLLPWHSHFALPSGLPLPSPQSQHRPLCFLCYPSTCQTRRYFRCLYLQWGQITQFLARHTTEHCCASSWKLCP